MPATKYKLMIILFIVALMVFGYLLYALIRPEKF